MFSLQDYFFYVQGFLAIMLVFASLGDMDFEGT